MTKRKGTQPMGEDEPKQPQDKVARAKKQIAKYQHAIANKEAELEAHGRDAKALTTPNTSGAPAVDLRGGVKGNQHPTNNGQKMTRGRHDAARRARERRQQQKLEQQCMESNASSLRPGSHVSNAIAVDDNPAGIRPGDVDGTPSWAQGFYPVGKWKSMSDTRKEELRTRKAMPRTASEEHFVKECDIIERELGRSGVMLPPPSSNVPQQREHGHALERPKQASVRDANGNKVKEHLAPHQQDFTASTALTPLDWNARTFNYPTQRSTSHINAVASSQIIEVGNHKQTTSMMEASAHIPTPQQDDSTKAEHLQKTVLAPYYERIQKDSDEIQRLRQERADLKAEIEQSKVKIQYLKQVTVLEVPAEEQQVTTPRGVKRKLPPASPMQIGDATNSYNQHTPQGHLTHLANEILNDLNEAVANETIHLCGLAALKILEDRPDDVLRLAHEKIHTWHYEKVPMCWRRLYEDASLAKAAQLLHEQASVFEAKDGPRKKRARGEDDADPSQDWFAEVVRKLDMGIMLTGTPGRALLFESVFQQLENILPAVDQHEVPESFDILPPKQLQTAFPIEFTDQALSFEAFQHHIDSARTPIIVPSATANWPARIQWQNPQYFLDQTLGGHRLVPVEIGQSYTDASWSQRIMSIREFFFEYLLSAEAKDIGYLAQHDLFSQIPTLKNDILIPDYCYTTPPPAEVDAARTSGLAQALQLDAPLLNAWFGPKGTQTPLHTDPYHNILCQVVGYKYIRLYPPSETPKLYPRGTDDKGISMENTSQVDVSKHVRTSGLTVNGKHGLDVDAVREEHRKFPLFEGARYVEGVLGPGECLYVPVGWWHYVEGLSTSFSVSFWWNSDDIRSKGDGSRGVVLLGRNELVAERRRVMSGIER